MIDESDDNTDKKTLEAAEANNAAEFDSRSLGDGSTLGPHDPTEAPFAPSTSSNLEDRFEIRGTLGHGGMGEVLLGWDKRLNREVAIKRILGDLANREAFQKRFEREARAVAKLDHPNIVRIYEYGVESSGPYLVLERVDGPSLKERLDKGGPLSVQETIGVVKQVAEALANAHSKGLIHRDIKPGNILLTAENMVKITDFGLAIQNDGAFDEGLTTTGAVLGTLAYMAPEQRENAHNVDARCDIWSLGAMVFHMTTGQVPHMLTSEELDRVPLELHPILKGTLVVDPARRFQSMAELISTLPTADVNHASPKIQLAVGECPNCALVTDSPKQFCEGCGQIMRFACPSCNEDLWAWIRFCGECGADKDAALEQLSNDAREKKSLAERHRAQKQYDAAFRVIEEIEKLTHPSVREFKTWALSFRKQVATEQQDDEEQRIKAKREVDRALEESKKRTALTDVEDFDPFIPVDEEFSSANGKQGGSQFWWVAILAFAAVSTLSFFIARNSQDVYSPSDRFELPDGRGFTPSSSDLGEAGSTTGGGVDVPSFE